MLNLKFDYKNDLKSGCYILPHIDMEIIHSIQTHLREVGLAEYELAKYVPSHGNEIGLEGNVKLSGDTLSNLEKELQNIKFHYIKKANEMGAGSGVGTGAGNGNTEGGIASQTLISDPDIFNIVVDNDGVKMVEWKQLTKDVQLHKLEEFFLQQNEHHLANIGQPPFDERVMQLVRELVENDKLYLKKDIEWDGLNQRISCIPLIRYHSASKTYNLANMGAKKNVKKISQNAVIKLMKKK